jgi:hypothetical protein
VHPELLHVVLVEEPPFAARRLPLVGVSPFNSVIATEELLVILSEFENPESDVAAKSIMIEANVAL